MLIGDGKPLVGEGEVFKGTRKAFTVNGEVLKASEMH